MRNSFEFNLDVLNVMSHSVLVGSRTVESSAGRWVDADKWRLIGDVRVHLVADVTLNGWLPDHRPLWQSLVPCVKGPVGQSGNRFLRTAMDTPATRALPCARAPQSEKERDGVRRSTDQIGKKGKSISHRIYQWMTVVPETRSRELDKRKILAGRRPALTR